MSIVQRSADFMREVEKLRRKYPESREWTQPIVETLNYVIYGRRCDWINDNFPDLGKEAS